MDDRQVLIGVDVGGTFTDVVAATPEGIKTVKVATEVVQTEKSVLAGAQEVGVQQADTFNHASTHGLNAVLTRRLPKIGFLTTIGHRDILDAGNVWRPTEALTDPHWRRSFGDTQRPLVPRYLRRGVRERMSANGEVLIPLDEADLREHLEVLRDCRVEGVAVCLLHAYAYPEHEQRIRQVVHDVLGPVACSISSEASPLAKEYERASTTVIDVLMKLIYHDYTDRLAAGLEQLGFGGSLNYANCAAQLVSADIAMEQPYNVVFAGPAAGTAASAHLGQLVDAQNLLCADVGGTSCDLSVVTGGQPFLNTTFELEHDLVVNALSTEISSIAAGGGSIVASNAAGELEVGPGSAGADPGPACYGRGGTAPTMTDVCLLMGIIDGESFAGGRMPLDVDLAVKAFEQLKSPLTFEQRVNYAYNVGLNNIAQGLINLAVRHGLDTRDYSLVAFGAAGPMLLPALGPAPWDLVQARDVIVPPHPGLFSALGLLSSDQVYADSQSAYTVLTADSVGSIQQIYGQMEDRLRERFREHTSLEISRSFDGRLLGQSFDTPFVPMPDGPIDEKTIDAMICSFHDVYESRLGNRFDTLPVEGVTYRVQARIPAPKVEYPRLGRRPSGALKPTREGTLRYLDGGQSLSCAQYLRDDLYLDDIVTGPAIIHEALSTTYVPHGKSARVGSHGELHIR